MKSYKKPLLSATYTMLILLMIMKSTSIFIFPVQVELELKAFRIDRCQVFYSDVRGFAESRSQIKSTKAGRFSNLTFDLPKAWVNKLRIDPGFQSAYYEIKKITISAGKESITWAGTEIAEGFTLTNLEIVDPEERAVLRLKSTTNSDVQLILQRPLHDYLTTINVPFLAFVTMAMGLLWAIGLIFIYKPTSAFAQKALNLLKTMRRTGITLTRKADQIFPKNLLPASNNNKAAYRKNQWVFGYLLLLLIADRAVSLWNFGFLYTDIDQTVMWNGAMDYSMGIFREPFFYGQDYNFMLEALLAVPLIWVGVPVYKALPIVTAVLSVVPFIALAFFFRKRNHILWAYLSLAVPVLLPAEYGFITNISRGNVQAHLFVPLLLIPFFEPDKLRNVALLYIASALCLLANQSSIIIVAPVFLRVYVHQYKSRSFYIKSLWIIPFAALYFLAKYYYVLHPEKILLKMSGLKPQLYLLLTNLKYDELFNHVFPLVSHWGNLYLVILPILIIAALASKNTKAFIFTASATAILCLSLTIPKAHTLYEGAGIFYHSSRFYILLAMVLILSLFLLIKNLPAGRIPVLVLLLITLINFSVKNFDIQRKAVETISETTFPVEENSELLKRSERLNQIAEEHQVSLIVHHGTHWRYVFDSYTFNPLRYVAGKNQKPITSVNISGDRRTWIYSDTAIHPNILLNGLEIQKEYLENFDHEYLSSHLILIKNNGLKNQEIFTKLNLEYGNLY
jgi:hypothetical protein